MVQDHFNNHRVIEIINKLDTQSRQNLHMLLCSSYFNRRKNIVILFEIIDKHIALNKSESLFYKKTHKLIYPNKPYIKQDVTRLLSNLNKLVEKFLIMENTMSDNFNFEVLLMQSVKDIHPEYLEKIILKLENSAEIKDASNLYNKFIIESAKCHIKSRKDNRIGDVNYMNTFSALEEFYAYNSLKLNCFMLNRSLAINISYQNLVNLDICNKYSDNVSIKCFLLAYESLLDMRSEVKYRELKEFIYAQHNRLNKEDVNVLLTILENITHIVVKGEEHYYSMLFELYEFQEKNQSDELLKGIHYHLFKNFVVVALKINQTKWVEKILEKYQNTIVPTEHSNEILSFCRASLHFAKKSFDEALLIINNVKFDDIYLKLALKRMYLKIYYELNEHITLTSAINSYRVYLSRENKIKQGKKSEERLFSNIIDKLYRMRVDPNTTLKNLEKFRQTILPNTLEYNWLQEKVLEQINLYQ